MVFILIIFIIFAIIGMSQVKEREEKDGALRAFGSLICLVIVLFALGLSLTGVGAVFGIPMLYLVAKFFGRWV